MEKIGKQYQLSQYLQKILFMCMYICGISFVFIFVFNVIYSFEHSATSESVHNHYLLMSKVIIIVVAFCCWLLFYFVFVRT